MTRFFQLKTRFFLPLIMVMSLVMLGACEDEGGQTAQAAQETQNIQSNTWFTRCMKTDAGQKCEIVKTMFIDNNGTAFRLAEISLAKTENGAVMGINAPLGIIISDGLAYQIGKGDLVKLPVRTCNQGGCIALANITNAQIQTMATQSPLSILFIDSAGKTVKVEFSTDDLVTQIDSLS